MNTKVSIWTRRIAYGSGDASCNIVVGLINAILILFYTDYIGIDPALVGMIMLVSRVFDGAGSLIVGILAERTKTKYGKYRPWILWNTIPFAISLVLLFTVPQTETNLQLIYIFIVYNLCTSVFYNLVNIPYGCLAYVMDRNPEERDMLSVIRMCLASVGRLLVVCGTMSLIKLWGNGQSAWVIAAVIWAVLAVVLLFFCFFKCKENVTITENDHEQNLSLLAGFRLVFANKYFWLCAGFQTVQAVYFVATGTSLTYYCKYVFGNDTWLYNSLYFVETIVLIVVMMLCPIAIRKYGKRKTAIFGTAIGIAGQFLLLVNPTSVPWAFVNSILRSAGMAPFNSVVFAFIGESVEYGYMKNNLRQEGLICSGCTVINKIGSGIATAIITGLLSLAGYVSSAAEAGQMVQSERVVNMIIRIHVYGPIIIFVGTILLLLVYNLEKILPNSYNHS